MRTHHHSRDLVSAAAYVVAVAAVVASLAFLPAPWTLVTLATIDTGSAIFETQPPQPTRLNEAVANAREIREALARPIPGPPPLPPITAQIAYGHLRPGGKGYAGNEQAKPRLPQAARDAMAMDNLSNQFYRGNKPVMPELHKVY